MANICFNTLIIKGNKTKMKDIIRIVNSHLEEGDELSLSFIDDLIEYSGYLDFDGAIMSIYHNIESENKLILSIESKWTPVKEFAQTISNTYKVSCHLEYDECSNDFAGYYKFNDGELIDEYEAEYAEGLYKMRDWNDFWEQVVVGHLDDAEFNYDNKEEFMEFFSFIKNVKQVKELSEAWDLEMAE